jgi:hypothetical protein
MSATGRLRTAAVLLACAGSWTLASAQTVTPARDVRQQPAPEPSTELALFAGASHGSSVTGAMLGGMAAWEISRWFGAEARGSWLDRGETASGFAADVSGTVNIGPKRTVTPYLGAGFGLYVSIFDDGVTHETLTDPAWRFTGGVDILSFKSWTVRPEVSALIVDDRDHGQTLTVFGVLVGYRFGDRRVTAARQAR